MSCSIMLGHPFESSPYIHRTQTRVSSLSHISEVTRLSKKRSQFLKSSLILLGKPILLGAININNRHNLVKISFDSLLHPTQISNAPFPPLQSAPQSHSYLRHRTQCGPGTSPRPARAASASSAPRRRTRHVQMQSSGTLLARGTDRAGVAAGSTG